jgi:hypothetical protein
VIEEKKNVIQFYLSDIKLLATLFLHKRGIERRGRVVNTPYLGGPGLSSRPGERLY